MGSIFRGPGNEEIEVRPWTTWPRIRAARYRIGGTVTSPKDQRERQIFDYLDQSLPNTLKSKLTSTEVRCIVETITHFVDFHSTELLPEQKKRDRDSRFDSGEGSEFLDGLSKL